ncbi:AcrR family transcriptional regulator [Novosphingobium chloroacetimidivorans]|uniref:AcrR family transcriptional regulator n=1 Tax=Novosphingobium chloroacetimidivorans TaxID=1428314 RepID=A0A7W7K8J2_9SPHN|nr:TetR/AcrR family transcriptional regulator [Novosphingobium chloroacetimidivorans]MBB4857664.1 AcrR family transcriptional regulator [Novosphingobium chloroacetimidivorans]
MSDVEEIATPGSRGGGRRMGAKSSETRTFLLDIAETIMREEGYAAVTSRQLAKAAQMSPQIVYYYFRTMDDLFEAVFLRLAQGIEAALEEAALEDEPILAMWKLSSDPSRATIVAEFLALANHRKGIAAVISQFGVRYQARQAQIIEATLAERGIDLPGWTPQHLATVLENLARSFLFGTNFAIPAHLETHAFVTDWLSQLFARKDA